VWRRSGLSHQWAVCSAAREAIPPVGSGGAHGFPTSGQWRLAWLSHQWAVAAGRAFPPLASGGAQGFATRRHAGVLGSRPTHQSAVFAAAPERNLTTVGVGGQA